MTNEKLKTFLAVVEQGSFRKAAKVVFKTQASVSAAIKSLEEEYGILLFNREEYRPTLTKAGEAFYQQSKLAIEQMERLDTMGHQLSKGVEPRFNIVIGASFPLPPLLKKIKSIIKNFPNTQFKIFTESLHGVVEPINDGEADLAFGPEFGLNPTHEKMQVSKATLINVAAPNYIKSSSQRMIGSEEIRKYSQIILCDSAKHSDKASIYTTSNQESWIVNDLTTKKELALAGLGWGRIPEHLIERELASGQLIPINVEGIPVKTTGVLYMFRMVNREQGPVAIKFWKELKEAYNPPTFKED
ncbi:MAG: LysR family transcriptional regulator [SAR324 cluster bacterium]|nr:LysR family transcriptional regulator [SAR324 cluster bacterium]